MLFDPIKIQTRLGLQCQTPASYLSWFWLALVEGNKVNSLSKLKNAKKKNQNLLLNEKFHLPLQGSTLEEERGGEVEPKAKVCCSFKPSQWKVLGKICFSASYNFVPISLGVVKNSHIKEGLG